MNSVIEKATTLRNRLANKEILIGTHIQNTDLQQIEMIAGIGFDYLWIDSEHSQADKKDLHDTLIAVRAAASKTAAFVRVADINPVLVKPILEMGPTGIVFPGAQSAEDVELAVASCRYPPAGVRGFGPRACIRYGLEDMTEYVTNNDQAVFKIIQLEHWKAHEDLDNILKVDGVDAFVLGPMDLSGSLGHYRNWQHPEVMEVIDDIIKRVRAAGKVIGVSTGAYDEKNLHFWLSRGIQLLSAGSENAFIMSGSKTVLKCSNSFIAELGK